MESDMLFFVLSSLAGFIDDIFGHWAVVCPVRFPRERSKRVSFLPRIPRI